MLFILNPNQATHPLRGETMD